MHRCAVFGSCTLIRASPPQQGPVLPSSRAMAIRRSCSRRDLDKRIWNASSRPHESGSSAWHLAAAHSIRRRQMHDLCGLLLTSLCLARTLLISIGIRTLSSAVSRTGLIRGTQLHALAVLLLAATRILSFQTDPMGSMTGRAACVFLYASKVNPMWKMFRSRVRPSISPSPPDTR